MNIVSLNFFLFFGVFFALYWLVFGKSKQGQNLILLIGSSVFYYLWNPLFLLILVGFFAVNFWLGIQIDKSSNDLTRKRLAQLGVLIAILVLGIFKYYNFFITSFNRLASVIGFDTNLSLLQLIIPIGISFYSFKTISYLLDVQKRKMEACKDPVIFYNFISFFPTVLAGPIDRARLFIPQLAKKREFSYELMANGARQVLWGLFKKMVIADNLVFLTDQVFNAPEVANGSALFIGALLYTVQIYMDFSGYSDLAIGFSKLIGFDVAKNFNYPYIAQNVADFWRRWHMSLTSWLTEYLFTPLSIYFRDSGKRGLIVAIVINFTLCGLWHGSRWTYILYGFLHGLYFIPLILKGTMNKKKKFKKDQKLPTRKEFFNIVQTLFLVIATFVVFRAEKVTIVKSYFFGMFDESILSAPSFSGYNGLTISIVVILSVVVFIVEWFQRNKEFALDLSDFKNKWGRWMIYQFLILCILILQSKEVEFIYQKF